MSRPPGDAPAEASHVCCSHFPFTWQAIHIPGNLITSRALSRNNLLTALSYQPLRLALDQVSVQFLVVLQQSDSDWSLSSCIARLVDFIRPAQLADFEVVRYRSVAIPPILKDSRFFYCLRPKLLCVFSLRLSSNSNLRTRPSNATYLPYVTCTFLMVMKPRLRLLFPN